jgi:hypothetical protein
MKLNRPKPKKPNQNEGNLKQQIAKMIQEIALILAIIGLILK